MENINSKYFKNDICITDQNLSRLDEYGFVIFEDIIFEQAQFELKRAINEFELLRSNFLLKDDIFSDILVDPKLNFTINRIMKGNKYHFHHMHAACHKAGTPSLGWHHDYEQYSNRDKSKTMIHVFLYLNGLNGEIGDLLLVPGSHKEIVRRYEYSDKELDYFDNIVRVNSIKSGSVIIINSALIHARDSQSGGELNPRYFIDISFCQGGATWPPYREVEDWEKILPYLNKKYEDNPFQKFLFDSKVFKSSALDSLLYKSKLYKLKSEIRRIVGRKKIKNIFIK